MQLNRDEHADHKDDTDDVADGADGDDVFHDDDDGAVLIIMIVLTRTSPTQFGHKATDCGKLFPCRWTHALTTPPSGRAHKRARFATNAVWCLVPEPRFVLSSGVGGSGGSHYILPQLHCNWQCQDHCGIDCRVDRHDRVYSTVSTDTSELTAKARHNHSTSATI